MTYKTIVAEDFQIKLEDSQYPMGGLTPKAVSIRFNLSHGGKIINNRTYIPVSLNAGVTSWTTPYKKPVLKNHDSHSEPIGRIVEAEYVATHEEARSYLNDDEKFYALVSAFESGEPKEIRKAMLNAKVVNDPMWPGLGKIMATAKITDPDAIQKFLDERYLTFSQSSTVSEAYCSTCGAAWHKGDSCEHTNVGDLDEDENPYFYIAKGHNAIEASVVNSPADNLGYIVSIVSSDSQDDQPTVLRTPVEVKTCTLVDCEETDMEVANTDENADTKAAAEDAKENVKEDAEESVKEDAPKQIPGLIWEFIHYAQQGILASRGQLLEDKDLPKKQIFLCDKYVPIYNDAYASVVREIIESLGLEKSIKDQMLSVVETSAQDLLPSVETLTDDLTSLRNDFKTLEDMFMTLSQEHKRVVEDATAKVLSFAEKEGIQLQSKELILALDEMLVFIDKKQNGTESTSAEEKITADSVKSILIPKREDEKEFNYTLVDGYDAQIARRYFAIKDISGNSAASDFLEGQREYISRKAFNLIVNQ